MRDIVDIIKSPNKDEDLVINLDNTVAGGDMTIRLDLDKIPNWKEKNIVFIYRGKTVSVKGKTLISITGGVSEIAPSSDNLGLKIGLGVCGVTIMALIGVIIFLMMKKK
jgi:hypothetical protein